MNNDTLRIIEKKLFGLFLIMGVIVVVGIILMVNFDKGDLQSNQSEETEEETYVWEDGLSDSTIWMPDYCMLYSKVPEFTFTDIHGTLHSINEYEGKPTIVVFWASWCEDCQKQMPLMKYFCEMTKTYADVNFLFINKTDGEKETRESAVKYFNDLGIEFPIYFDEKLESYKLLGIHNIPTTMFLDEKGTLTACYPKQITEQSVYEAILEKALYGGSYATSKFIQSSMLDSAGAVHSIYAQNQEETYASDVLSESEGLLLRYAVMSRNKQLFEQIWGYVKVQMMQESLAAWKISGGNAAQVNALIDDFRIWSAVKDADELWGGYKQDWKEYSDRIIKYGIQDGKYVDFYDHKHKEYSKRCTLCYGDLKTLEELATVDYNLEEPYQKARHVVENGQISDCFPLYYSWYNYENNEYEKDDLNMAEEMVTFLHMAEMDALPDNALSWLRTQLEHGGLKARYHVNGEVVEGYDYESTAVYALVAMVGEKAEDSMIVSKAMMKMEKLRNDDSSLAYNGSFGMEDGTGITSFDQLVPIMAYMNVYGK